MKRREFISLIGGTAALTPFAARAQQTKLARIGLVSLHSPAMASHVNGIRQELHQLGHVEGKTIEIKTRFTDGNRPQAQEVINLFLAKRVDVILAWSTATAQLAKQATQTVPVVMISSDPVAAKLVQSLSRPGSNLTGVSTSGPDLSGKRLELLREIKPGLRTVAFLGYGPGAAAFIRESRAGADKIGMNVLPRVVDRPEAVDAALFAAMKRDGAEAVIVQPFFVGYASEIVALSLQAGLPVVADYPPFTKAGALASLGIDVGAQVRRTAYFIDRILKGAKPEDLPVEQPTKFELTINLKTAKALGIEVPPLLISRADEVIE